MAVVSHPHVCHYVRPHTMSVPTPCSGLLPGATLCHTATSAQLSVTLPPLRIAMAQRRTGLGQPPTVQDCTLRSKGPVVAGVVVVEVDPAMVACKAGPVQAEVVGVGLAVQSPRLLRVTGTHHQPSLWYVCVCMDTCSRAERG